MCAGELEAAGAEAATAAELAKARAATVAALEDDLLAAQGAGTGPGSSGGPRMRQAAATEAAGMPALANGGTASAAEVAALLAEEGDGGEEGPGPGQRSMVSVICAQRDRLKARVAAAEEERAQVRGSFCPVTACCAPQETPNTCPAGLGAAGRREMSHPAPVPVRWRACGDAPMHGS